MAIHPRYADAIFTGLKTVEFRKRRLASDIRTVVVYATAPVSGMVGVFGVERIEVSSPQLIWNSFGGVGVINEAEFFEYYRCSEHAVAIVVRDAERFDTPVALHQLDPRPGVPQSFTYLSADLVSELLLN